jgi:hypothetical protein
METFIKEKTEVTSENFSEIADSILNHSVLLINEQLYRIVEIEFYLHCECHPDHYAHRDVDQLQYSGFYFHKHQNNTYKNGTRRGMDLSLGNIESKKYCGILIRSLLNLSTGILTEGPCLCVNKILEEYKSNSILEFVNSKYEFPLKIIDYKLQSEPTYAGPRIGLQSKTSSIVKAQEYVNRAYRFLTHKHKIKKGKRDLKIIL